MTRYEDILRKDPLVETLQQNGWQHIQGKNLARQFTEPLILQDLKTAIQNLNPQAQLSEIEIQNLIEQLRNKTASSKHAKDILQYLRDGIPATPKKTGTLTYIRLISDDVTENTYIVADEVTHQQQENEIRCDIILYINGIPLVNIECKDPTNTSVTWVDAYHQIQKYQSYVPELYKYVQIGIAADARIKYFATTPWDTERIAKIAEWNISDEPVTNISHQLKPQTLTNIIKNYTFIRTVKGTDTKILPRYIQYRATEKIVSRVEDNLKGETHKNKGLIWHWQGSGKTLTMTYTANKLYRLPELQKPTIFFVTDRTDLETQLITEYSGVAGLPKITRIQSIRQLIDALAADQFKGKREIMAVLVQKFRPDELKQIEKELKNYTETIATRKNIILLIDEAHRTQEGILSGEMRNKLLKNAFAFAFTGTPNATDTKNTFTEFSYPPEEEYLDKYDMGDSNKDGFTLPITYKPKPFDADIQTNKEAIEAFLNQYLDDIDDIDTEKVEAKIKKQINACKLFLENPEHIQKVAKDIAQHYQETVEPAGFKAMLICSSRKACALYKQELDKLLPKGKAEVVMTYQATEKDTVIKNFQTQEKSRHPNKDETTITNEYRDNYKEQENPKILIVCDKLITGFDEPSLQTIYLDKLIKGNKLLQAITRSNRPKENKEYGVVIDYIGIFTHLEKALTQYSRGSLGAPIYNETELKETYTKEIEQLITCFKGIEVGSTDTIEEAVEYLVRDSDTREEFQKRLRRLTNIRKIIESSADVIDGEETYKWFSNVNDAYNKLYNDDVIINTDTLYSGLWKNISVGNLSDNIQTYQVSGSQKPTPTPKAVNIVIALEKFVKIDHQKPAYESLIEKIERTIQEWRETKIDDLKLCRDGTLLLREKSEIDIAVESTHLSELSFGILTFIKEEWGDYDTLEQEIDQLDKKLCDKTLPLIFDGWKQQPTAVKTVEQEIMRFLRREGRKLGKTLDDANQLFEKIRKVF